MKTIQIDTGQPYPVQIGSGILKKLGSFCRERFPRSERVCVVSDSNVFPLYGRQVLESLRDAGFESCPFVFQAGEESKRLDTIAEMYGAFTQQRLTRADFTVALGGGVTGDMCGFASATYLRGIPFVQIPTSLLAQVDSSVGGKTGVDLPQGKNLVGAFWQPSLVLIDPNTLKTLPSHFYADGMAEVIKTACIKDAFLFQTLEENTQKEEDLIAACVAIKGGVVERDEKEAGERMLLNFGHTVGHALEKAHHYRGLSHGGAVGIGMVAITRAAEAAGLTEPGTAKRIAALLEKFHLPTEDPSVTLEQIVQGASADKKTAGSMLNLVLLNRIGESYVYPVPLDAFHPFLMGGSVVSY